MADGSFPNLVSKDRNSNAATNAIYVTLTDQTDTALVDGSGNLQVILAANSGVDIGDVDVTSVIPGVGATNLGKAEDAVHASGDTGVQMLAVRNDTLAALAGTDGDYAPLQVDADGALYITGTITSSPGDNHDEDTAHTTGDTGSFSLAVRNDTLATLVSADGDYAPFQVDADGALYTTIRDGGNSITVDNSTLSVVGGGTEATALRVTIASDSTGLLSIDDNGGSITVDGTVAATQSGTWVLGANSGVDIGDVDVTSVIPGTGATNLGKAEDAVHASGDVGVQALAVRNDTLAALAGTDGDYAPLQVNASGALYVALDTTADAILVDDSAFTVATDNVNVAGFLADETAPDSVDEGDVGAARMTLDRKQLHVLVDATTDSQRLAIDSSGNAQVDLAAVSVTAVPVSKDSSANTETNPIFVSVTNAAVSGSEVHDYDTAAAVASDATSNHDYTVANSTFLLKSVIWSGSGNVKVEVQTGPLASLATVAVGFLNGRNGDTKQIFFDPAKEVPVASTGTVRVIRTNRQGAATDVYSTIIGNDI